MFSVGVSDLFGIWGSGPSDVWAVGSTRIVRWNGTSWALGAPSTVVTNRLNHVWGTGPADVLAVGGNGTILRWNGVAWSSQTSPTPAALSGVWGISSDVWVVGGGLPPFGSGPATILRRQWVLEVVENVDHFVRFGRHLRSIPIANDRQNRALVERQRSERD